MDNIPSSPLHPFQPRLPDTALVEELAESGGHRRTHRVHPGVVDPLAHRLDGGRHVHVSTANVLVHVVAAERRRAVAAESAPKRPNLEVTEGEGCE